MSLVDPLAKARAALLDHLPKDAILARYQAAGGQELISGKFANPESSAALAANAFGLFGERPDLLSLPGDCLGGHATQNVDLEAQIRFPWSGGLHPWLDVGGPDGRAPDRYRVQAVRAGPNAFRRWSSGDDRSPEGQWESKLNVALWDTVLYTFAFFEKRQIVPVADAIREEFLDLMSTDDTFVDYIGRTTDKPDRVRYRADTWCQRLEAAVVVPAGEVRAFSRKLKEDLHAADPTCAICGQHIHAAEDAEVDHIKHYWRGGATIPKNARLTHRHWNRARSGR